MREFDGRRVPKAAKEEVRRRVVAAIEAGGDVGEVARAFGLHPRSPYPWLRKYREGGERALDGRKPPGKRSLLDGDEQALLVAWVMDDLPTDHGFTQQLWTSAIVTELIARKLGHQMHPASVRRLLRRLGLSPQKPAYRSWKADPGKVKEWVEETFPAIVAEAEREGAEIYFGDEASVRADHHAGRTWGQKGVTPVVASSGDRYSVNMISAVTRKGVLRFRFIDGRMDSGKFIAFCRQLLADAARPVTLIVDGHSIHKSKKVQAWLDRVNAQTTRFRIYHLPPYSPQLNPDEWVWKHVKADHVGRRSATSRDDLKRIAKAALLSLQHAPAKVAAFFADKHLAYIAAGHGVEI